MPRTPSASCLTLALLLAFAASAHGEDAPKPGGYLSAATAYAPPLSDIKIDGDTSDWPRDATRYPIESYYGVYGPTDLERVDLRNNADLSASFMVGYDTERGEVLVAIVVRDNEAVIGDGYDKTDAVEIYLRGLPREKPEVGGRFSATQYHGVAGHGSYGVNNANPGLLWGDINAAAPRFAHSRKGDTTTYEFALKPFDDFSMLYQRSPQTPTKLEPGKRLSFDIGVADKDNDSLPPALVFWGPLGAEKYFDPSLLGDLVLLRAASDLVPLTGTITRADNGEPYAGLSIEAWGPGGPGGVTYTDAKGHYEFRLPAAKYTLQPTPCRGAKSGQSFQAEVVAGKAAELNLKIEPIQLPQSLRRAVALYGKAKSYSDQTTLTLIGEAADGHDVRHVIPIEFAFERPNRVHIACKSPLLGGITVASDGRRIAAAQPQGALGEPIAVPQTITELVLSRVTLGLSSANGGSIPMPAVMNQSARSMLPTGGLIGGLFPHRLVLSDNAEAEVLYHADRIEEIGPGTVDARKVTFVEITKPGPDVLTGFPYFGMRRGLPVTFRVAIDDEDATIRQTTLQFDMTKCLNPLFYQDRKFTSQFVTWTTRHRDVAIDKDQPADLFTVPPRAAAIEVEKP